MNQKSWKCMHSTNKSLLDFTWYNKCRAIQRSLKYNSDPNAVVIHHLRDTEEQRKYNDELYELWGFEIDENGNEHFEYGKYVIFVTEEWHNTYHSQSDETRQKRSESLKGHTTSEETKRKISIANKGCTHTREAKNKISVILRRKYSTGWNPNKGRVISDQTRLKLSNSHKGKALSSEHRSRISEALKNGKSPWKGKSLSEGHKNKIGKNNARYMSGKHHTEETKKKISESKRGEKNPMYGKKGTLCPNYGRRGELNPLYGKKMSDELKESIRNMRRAISSFYKEYKSNNGTLTWNEFNHNIKYFSNNICELSSEDLLYKYALKLISYREEENRPREIKQMKTNYLRTDKEELE